MATSPVKPTRIPGAYELDVQRGDVRLHALEQLLRRGCARLELADLDEQERGVQLGAGEAVVVEVAASPCVRSSYFFWMSSKSSGGGGSSSSSSAPGLARGLPVAARLDAARTVSQVGESM